MDAFDVMMVAFCVDGGYSTCSYDPLNGPAIWSSKVRDGRVCEWRVYEDNNQNRRNINIIE